MSLNLRTIWKMIRELSGDDAYERYLKNFHKLHTHDEQHECDSPLSKAEFFKQWQDEKWQGIKRCC